MSRRTHPAGFVVATALAFVALTVAFPVAAGSVRGDQVTITVAWNSMNQNALQPLIGNFERVNPSITVNASFLPNTQLFQLELIELAAGNGPDVMYVAPGCGSSVSICVLAKDGYLAPMVHKPWTRRSLPLVTSTSKLNKALYLFLPVVAPMGMFTNDALFHKLGLAVPQTFAQLLSVCQKAKADNTVAVLFPGGSSVALDLFLSDLAVPNVYAKDKHWTADLKAGSVTFDGTAGWHQALQEFVEMNNAGCFEPGATGYSSSTPTTAMFAQGQGLMTPTPSNGKGLIDADDPTLSYSFHPFPAGSAPGETQTFLNLGGGLGVNAHSSPANQAAAQAFVDFVARPAQDALYAKVGGGLTQYQFLKNEIPEFMSPMTSILQDHAYIVAPPTSWWNPNVELALEQQGEGLLTGQTTIDDVLNAMDAAWKQGPS